MLNAAYGMLAMLPVALWAGRVRDGVAMTASRPGLVTESASSTIDPDGRVRCAANGGLETIV